MALRPLDSTCRDGIDAFRYCRESAKGKERGGPMIEDDEKKP